MSIWKRVTKTVFGGLILKVVEKENKTDTYIIDKANKRKSHTVVRDGEVVFDRTVKGKIRQDNANGIVDGRLASSAPRFNRESRRGADKLFGTESRGSSGGGGCGGCPYR